MKDYLEEAERVWRAHTDAITWIFAPDVHDQERTIIPIVATALRAAYWEGVDEGRFERDTDAYERAYRSGVKAMRERFAQDWTPGKVYSQRTARTFAAGCAENVLGEVNDER